MNPDHFACILQVISLAASAIIFCRAEPAINLMGRRCRMPIRVAFWLLLVGSAGLMLLITQGYAPNLPVALALCGVAVLLVSERRLRSILRTREPVPYDRRTEP